MMMRNGNQKIWRRMLWILALTSFLCLTKDQSSASYLKNTRLLLAKTHSNIASEKNHQEVPHHSGPHETAHNADKPREENHHHQNIDDNNRHESSAYDSQTHGHSPSIPLHYKLYWIGLILLVILLLVYFLIIYKKEKITSLKTLSILLLLLALSLYFLEQGRIFSGYFDPRGGVFVPPFHEPNTIGFLRFLYKLMTGIALSIYGFIIFFSHKSHEPKNQFTQE